MPGNQIFDFIEYRDDGLIFDCNNDHIRLLKILQILCD